MRILWFTNTFVPGKEQSQTATLRGSGGWMVALYESLLRERPDFSLAIVTARPVRSPEAYRIGDVDCFVVPQPKEKRGGLKDRELQVYAAIVREWQPDVVHIHGTERFYGLLSARGMTETPTVISIQGLLGPYSEWYHYFGNRTLNDIFRMHRWVEPIVLRGSLWGLRRCKQAAKMEKEIIRSNSHFMGRTLWDRAHVIAMNPQAVYHHVDELLRDPFWDSQWSLEKCRRYRILFTNAGHPRKGLEVLLNVIPHLKSEYPDIQVCIAGNISHRSGYGRYIRRRLHQLGRHAVELGALNADEMSEELAHSHVYVSPSFIDNSPNALCEAQLVGMPVISTYTGGVPSLVEDGKTGLFFPTGDTPTLAAKLRDVFENDGLAQELGNQARKAARQRHDPDNVICALIQAYEDALRPEQDRTEINTKQGVT